MPYKFRLQLNNGGGHYECRLSCGRCSAQAAGGNRCKNRVCIGLSDCWVHTRKLQHLRVGPSTLRGAGKGLFAWEPANGGVVFNHGAVVCRYGGARLSRSQVDARVPGDQTAPYGLCEGNVCEDAACVRGIGSLANGHRRKRDCNVEYRFQAGELRLVALKNIRHNQEILAHYGQAYHFDAPHTTKPCRK